MLEVQSKDLGLLKSILPQVRLKAHVCEPQHPPGDLDKQVKSPSHTLRFQVDERKASF